MDYSEIWFMGLSSQKIEGSQGAPQNGGYDDEHGSYIRVMWMESLTQYENSLTGTFQKTSFSTFTFIFKP